MVELKSASMHIENNNAEQKHKHLKTKKLMIVLKEKFKSGAEIIAYVRDTYLKTKLTNAAGSPKEMFGIIKYLLGKDVKPSYPTTNNNENLAENFV